MLTMPTSREVANTKFFPTKHSLCTPGWDFTPGLPSPGLRMPQCGSLHWACLEKKVISPLRTSNRAGARRARWENQKLTFNGWSKFNYKIFLDDSIHIDVLL